MTPRSAWPTAVDANIGPAPKKTVRRATSRGNGPVRLARQEEITRRSGRARVTLALAKFLLDAAAAVNPTTSRICRSPASTRPSATPCAPCTTTRR
ncbi:MAG: hypothetical protein U1F87_16015 [Kiritimatiellia bacterium]